MALIDNLGREINNANMTLGEIKSLIGSLMKGKVGSAQPINAPSAKTEKNIEDIHKLFEEYTKDHKKEVDEQKNHLKQIVDTLKIVSGERKNKPKAPRDNSRQLDKIAKNTAGLGKKGSAWTHDIHCETVLKKILSVLLTQLHKDQGALNAYKKFEAREDTNFAMLEKKMSSEDMAKIKPGASTAADEDKEANKKAKPINNEKSLSKFRHMLYDIENQLNKISGIDITETLLKGIVKEEREFTQQIRAAAYETAGVTKENKTLQRVYEDIGSTVERTGFNRSESQKYYLKALKSGIRDNKKALSMTVSQLNVEKQIGVEAGSLHETFMDLTLSGKMNNAEIAQMGRGMLDVARNTGMSGEALLDAVKSSREFTENLKRSEQLTADSNLNIIEIVANAKKLGIEGQMRPLLEGMTSTTKLLYESSSQTKALLFSAASSVGRMDDLLNGTITRSKEGINAMAQGFDNILKRFGVESLDAVDNLSDEAKTKLNMQLKLAFGVELGDMRRTVEAMREAGKGMSERLQDINQKLALNLTVEEKAALLEQQRALKAGKFMQAMTAFSEAAKGAENMDQALEKFGRRKESFAKDLKELGVQTDDNAEIVKQSLQGALNELNIGRKKAGLQEVKIDPQDIEKAVQNKDQFAVLADRINKGSEELSTKNKLLTPMDQANQTLNQINESVRKISQWGIASMFNSVVGQLIALGSVFSSLGSGTAGFGVSLIETFASIKKLFPGKATEEVAKAGGKAADVGSKSKFLQPIFDALEKFKSRAAKTFSDLFSGITNVASRISKFFSSLMTNIFNLFSKLFKPITSLFTSISGSVSTFFVNLATKFYNFFAKSKLLSPIFKFFGFIGGVGKNLVRLGGPLAILVSVIDGIWGAFSGFSKTASNFEGIIKKSNGEMKELTTSMYISSTVGGALYGILNGLTFGLYGMMESAAGVGGALEKTLTFITHGFMVFFEGLYEGIKEGWKYLDFSDMFKEIGQQFQGIGDTILQISNIIFSALGIKEVKNFEEAFINLWKVIKPVGYWIGWVISALIKTLGVVLIKIFQVLIGIVDKVVKAVKNVIMIVGGLGQAFYGLYKLFSGVFFSIMALFAGGGMKEAWNIFMTTIYDGFTTIGTGLLTVFGEVGEFLYNTIVSWIPGMGKAKPTVAKKDPVEQVLAKANTTSTSGASIKVSNPLQARNTEKSNEVLKEISKTQEKKAEPTLEIAKKGMVEPTKSFADIKKETNAKLVSGINGITNNFDKAIQEASKDIVIAGKKIGVSTLEEASKLSDEAKKQIDERLKKSGKSDIKTMEETLKNFGIESRIKKNKAEIEKNNVIITAKKSKEERQKEGLQRAKAHKIEGRDITSELEEAKKSAQLRKEDVQKTSQTLEKGIASTQVHLLGREAEKIAPQSRFYPSEKEKRFGPAKLSSFSTPPIPSTYREKILGDATTSYQNNVTPDADRIRPITPTAINNVGTAVALNNAGTQPEQTKVQGFDVLNEEAAAQTRIQQDLLSVMQDVKNLLQPPTTTETGSNLTADTSARTKIGKPPMYPRVASGNYFKQPHTNMV